MGACREASKMERALDRFISKLRSVDKVLWVYSGKNIENEKHPLDSLAWLDDEVEEAHTLWFEFLEEKRNERLKVIEIHNKKFPPTQESLNKIVNEGLQQSIISALTPKK